jgi:Patatin-like phospholipase
VPPQASPFSKGRHVLALDGGGVRGILTLEVLVRFEAHFGVAACDAFDLFAGTSTGAIIAALLGFARMRAAEILSLYDEITGRIFAPRLWSRTPFRYVAFRMYRREPALERLGAIFGERRLGEMPAGPRGYPPALLLTTHDLARNEELFLSNFPFRSGKPNFGRTWRVRDAVAASALSAPWYFGPFEGRFIDGGATVFNTPARQAAFEALDYCAEPVFRAGETVVWSFGSGSFASVFRPGQADAWFPWQWASRLFRDIQGDAEADQIYGARRLERAGEIALRRYQITIGKETLNDLGVSDRGIALPIALDRADAREFLHEVGTRFAERILWDAPDGFVLEPRRPGPAGDPALWRPLGRPPG